MVKSHEPINDVALPACRRLAGTDSHLPFAHFHGDLHETFTSFARIRNDRCPRGCLARGFTDVGLASDDDAAPKFSTFASADDLAAEVKILIADLEKAVVNEEEYKSQVEGRFTRDGNTITLIAIALGLHDQDSPLKPHAKAIAAAARKLAETKDYATTKQAIEDLKAAVDGKGTGGGELKWGKVAKLKGLMKDEVPTSTTS